MNSTKTRKLVWTKYLKLFHRGVLFVGEPVVAQAELGSRPHVHIPAQHARAEGCGERGNLDIAPPHQVVHH